jgi:excinuclease ABC subunit B
MANPPDDRPGKPPKKTSRQPAKPHKDPARPTRAKAAREELPPIAPALADLLNPAINRGEAGVGSQTGLDVPPSGLQPPPDNSRDRRADSAAAHRARASTSGKTAEGLGERPQTGYVAKSPAKPPAGPCEIDPDLARAFGITDEEDTGSPGLGEAGISYQDPLRLPPRHAPPRRGRRPSMRG